MMQGRRSQASSAGFTLIETLIATAMMVAILAALATVTAQWLPNWDRGLARVQRSEQLAFGLERIVSDLAAAQYVPPDSRTKEPLFEGRELSVTFVRTAVGPSIPSGLEIIRFEEVSDRQGLAMVRSRSRFMPLPPDTAAATYFRFADPVALLRAPYRVSFAYAGPDRLWQNIWRDTATLPRAVRITVRNAATEQTLAVSTATLIRVRSPADCVQPSSPTQCN